MKIIFKIITLIIILITFTSLAILLGPYLYGNNSKTVVIKTKNKEIQTTKIQKIENEKVPSEFNKISCTLEIESNDSMSHQDIKEKFNKLTSLISAAPGVKNVKILKLSGIKNEKLFVIK